MRKKSNRKVLFAERLKELRTAKPITQKALGLELGFSEGAIGEWENRGKQPDYSTLCDIAIFFDVSTDYLLGLED